MTTLPVQPSERFTPEWWQWYHARNKESGRQAGERLDKAERWLRADLHRQRGGQALQMQLQFEVPMHVGPQFLSDPEARQRVQGQFGRVLTGIEFRVRDPFGVNKGAFDTATFLVDVSALDADHRERLLDELVEFLVRESKLAACARLRLTGTLSLEGVTV